MWNWNLCINWTYLKRLFIASLSSRTSRSLIHTQFVTQATNHSSSVVGHFSFNRDIFYFCTYYHSSFIYSLNANIVHWLRWIYNLNKLTCGSFETEELFIGIDPNEIEMKVISQKEEPKECAECADSNGMDKNKMRKRIIIVFPPPNAQLNC